MVDDDVLEQVRGLRARGLTPKAIAATLGIRRAEAEAMVRAVAKIAPCAEPALVGCWVNPGWSHGLRWDGAPDWRDLQVDHGGMPGLVCVLVVRDHRHGDVSACGYLVDAHCLGVKDTLGPKVLDRTELAGFVATYFRAYDDAPLPAPLALAQELVLGAEAYARGLGFQPHPDLERCRGHLGAWTGPGKIVFGRHGRPLFVRGPYDDARSIVRTLERSVGRGNFDAVLLA